ncbi:MAG: hypothetical protein J5802_11810 [Butyrivibrio sp.]|nr:hypothetical protein [Butyrivibrio sp.]
MKTKKRKVRKGAKAHKAAKIKKAPKVRKLSKSRRVPKARKVRKAPKNRRARRANKNRKLIILTGITVAAAFFLVFSLVVILVRNMRSDTQVAETPGIFETLHESDNKAKTDNSDNSIVRHITGAGKTVSEALSQRPPTVEMTPENTAEFASIDSCSIVDGGKVEVSVTSPGIPASDDKYYYLFEHATYEDGPAEGAEPVTRIYKGDSTSFKVDLKKGAADSRLFSKFQVAVKKDGDFVTVSHPKYITNPGACAEYSYGGMSHKSIKGILPYPVRLSELSDLGVNYCAYNIPLSHILTSSGGIAYSYGGVTYHFNAQIINDYDTLFKRLNDMGIDVAAIILNNASTSAFPEITHPSARSGSTAPYYMFNASDEKGVKALAAIGSFLANRYSGSGHGNVSMWIIANEVNARKEYNYMANTDVNTYTAAFTRAFRVFYNAIKSQNSAAKVYIPIDQRWTYNTEKTGDYDAKDVLDIFASSISEYGNVDWGLAAHPYSFPNGNTEFWKASKYVNHTESTPTITMENIEVLTNYMQKDSMRDTSGNVRSIILSEVGYSSSSGQDVQAAAFAYAYTKMVKNGHIDALMLSRQVDAADEIASLGLALGLETTDGAHKRIYDVFKYIDTDKRNEVVSFAYNIVGKTF